MIEEEQSQSQHLVRRLAPEDIVANAFITVIEEVDEFVMWCQVGLDAFTPLGVRSFVRIPEEAGEPVRVLSVCLPFVYVSTADGSCRTLDVRKQHVARVSQEYARCVWASVSGGRSRNKRKR